MPHILNEYTRYDFFDWCFTRDPDETIDHGCGWATCAFGLWAGSLGVLSDDELVDVDPDKLGDVDNDCDNEELHCRICKELSSIGCEWKTFGKLQEAIAEEYDRYKK
ncbi:hypothetical protein [Endozoicomonas ascidiicola]|uniref:hypothetical protein n=1 Tax=Endozoicomonas ascidiicola TaxID=1698521 RepID=UPI00082CCD69|nr:hypothetical protein [Endozoicomonas ascidiicola]